VGCGTLAQQELREEAIMGTNLLSLPVDIPWRRLCVTPEMVDTTYADERFPFKWRPSTAIFTYEPPAEDQPQPGYTVSYLKVACTITGFQPAEDPELAKRVASDWDGEQPIAEWQRMLRTYYGCFGAIVQVAVFPKGDPDEVAKIPKEQFPYFADFEPKRRELYEIVTETGEAMSRTLEQVGVNKGLTTTGSDEVLDVFAGSSSQGGGGFSFLGIGIGGSGASSQQGQWGTRSMNSDQVSNVRTSDQAREARETLSHTTQLTQMYHQLDSYHLGTNRAVFFLLPRPHIVDVPNGFVDGPRRLEGIQEFFLAVVRPSSIEDICVDVHLETAHIATKPLYEYETKVDTVEFSLKHHIRVTDREDLPDSVPPQPKQDSETYLPPDGWAIDLSRPEGPYEVTSQSGNPPTLTLVGVLPEPSYTVEVDRDRLVINGTVWAAFDDVDGTTNRWYDGRLEVKLNVFIRKKTPDEVGHAEQVFVHAWPLSCCEPTRYVLNPGWLSWESKIQLLSPVPVGKRMTLAQANEKRAEIGQELLHSVRDGDRYPAGAVQFADAHVLRSALAGAVSGPDDPDHRLVADLPELDEDLPAP
jgi:hypothetical protein